MTVPTTNDHAHPPNSNKIKKCSVSNANWYVDQTRCEENENKVPDDRRLVERPRPPTPPHQIKKCPVFNENRRLDHIRCGESENDSPDGQRQRYPLANLNTLQYNGFNISIVQLA